MQSLKRPITLWVTVASLALACAFPALANAVTSPFNLGGVTQVSIPMLSVDATGNAVVNQAQLDTQVAKLAAEGKPLLFKLVPPPASNTGDAVAALNLLVGRYGLNGTGPTAKQDPVRLYVVVLTKSESILDFDSATSQFIPVIKGADPGAKILVSSTLNALNYLPRVIGQAHSDLFGIQQVKTAKGTQELQMLDGVIVRPGKNPDQQVQRELNILERDQLLCTAGQYWTMSGPCENAYNQIQEDKFLEKHHQVVSRQGGQRVLKQGDTNVLLASGEPHLGLYVEGVSANAARIIGKMPGVASVNGRTIRRPPRPFSQILAAMPKAVRLATLTVSSTKHWEKVFPASNNPAF